MKKNSLFIAIVMLCAITKGYTQASYPCCLTNSLVINTGYDPTTGGVIAPGVCVPYGPGTPSIDPHWTVTYLSPDNQNYFTSGYLTPSMSGTYSAYVVNTSGWPSYPGCNWISIGNESVYPTVAGAYYDAVFTRTFNLCSPDCLNFNLNIAFDYNVLSVKIDGTSMTWGSGFCSGCIVSAFYSSVCLGAGAHTLSIELVNDAWTYPTNGYGLDLYGTISSAASNNSLVSEGSGCSGWAFCSEPPISGPGGTLCLGSSATLTDVEPGGTWTTTPATVATITPTSATTASITGVSTGNVAVTYTDPGGRATYYYDTVVVCPTPCCLTSSLTINTGYDPTTGIVIPPGTCVPYGPGVPSTDPHWTVTYLSSDNQNYFTSGYLLPYLTPSYPAYVVNTTGWPSYPGCNWISIGNESVYPTVYGAYYDAIFTRTFTLCSPDCLNFNLNLAFDYNVLSVSIDGTSMAWSSSFCSGCIVSAFYPSVCLGAGTHTLSIELMNDAWTYPTNGYGLDAYGTISSATGLNTLVSEAAGCSGFSFCAEPPINGANTVCVGSTITLTDPEGGGSWSVAPVTVATVSTASSTTASLTGISAGIANVTYTDPCGRQVYFTVTVNVCPTPCCLTSSLYVSTGYDPASGSVIAPGVSAPYSAGLPNTDPHWQVTYLSTDDANYFSSGYLLPAMSVSYPAYVVYATGWPTYPGCNYISIGNEGVYPTVYGATYDAVFSRTFTMCSPDCLNFNLNISFDYNVVSVKIDGTSMPWSSSYCSGCIVPASYTSVCLGAGTHTLSIELMNDAWTWPTNGYGLDVAGSISSATSSNSLISEAAGCSGWTFCNEPPISGPTTVCVGSSITLTDPEPGGMWTAGPPAVGSIAPVTTTTASFTGMSVGTSTITYTDPCGRAVYYTVNVTPGATGTFCVSRVTVGGVQGFKFTGPAGCTVTFNGVSYMGGYVCGPYTIPSGGFISWTSLVTMCGGGSLDGVCITGVTCGACVVPYTPGPCSCAYMNGPRATPSGSGVSYTENGDLALAPNPNQGSFTVSGDLPGYVSSTEVNLQVVDMLGRVVYQDLAHISNGGINKEITLGNNVASGVYLLKIKNDEVSQVIRFTVGK